MRLWHLLAIAALPCVLGATQDLNRPLHVLPARATTQLAESLRAASVHRRHVWRDMLPTNTDGTVSAYIEIARGDRRKWEFDMRANTRAIDRVIPDHVGGYPVNYGFVPQTVSYDGDPFDALVLGPPLKGGEMVRGIVVGLMYMEDEKGLDSKVVLSAAGRDGRPLHQLTTSDRQLIADYFRRYKAHEAGAYSRVPGWGSVAEAHDHVTMTHVFFLKCRERPGEPCPIVR